LSTQSDTVAVDPSPPISTSGTVADGANVPVTTTSSLRFARNRRLALVSA
jgi:hypothetical protein